MLALITVPFQCTVRIFGRPEIHDSQHHFASPAKMFPVETTANKKTGSVRTGART
jgi:hypothetical protein